LSEGNHIFFSAHSIESGEVPTCLYLPGNDGSTVDFSGLPEEIIGWVMRFCKAEEVRLFESHKKMYLFLLRVYTHPILQRKRRYSIGWSFNNKYDDT
jgi:hypothetical protein